MKCNDASPDQERTELDGMSLASSVKHNSPNDFSVILRPWPRFTLKINFQKWENQKKFHSTPRKEYLNSELPNCNLGHSLQTHPKQESIPHFQEESFYQPFYFEEELSQFHNPASNLNSKSSEFGSFDSNTDFDDFLKNQNCDYLRNLEEVVNQKPDPRESEIDQIFKGSLSKNLTKISGDRSKEANETRKHPSLSGGVYQGQEIVHDHRKLKKLFLAYFYCSNEVEMSTKFNLLEMMIIRIFLIKKLIHDNNKGMKYRRIMRLKSEELGVFMKHHQPINRKNVVKMSIFIKIWNFLQTQKEETFWEYYFNGLVDSSNSSNSILYSLRRERLTNRLKITDEFYRLCFKSQSFRDDFFATLSNLEFRSFVLQSSKNKFSLNFEDWVTKMATFVKEVNFTLTPSTRIPEIKFGLSEADYNSSFSLFKSLIKAIDS
jgi:hypothetical protein